MASYLEVMDIWFNRGSANGSAAQLKDKVRAAVLVAAQLVLSGGDTGAPFDQSAGKHDQRVKWAVQSISERESATDELFAVVLAANVGVSQAGLLGASDSAIQTNVNEVVDALAVNLA